MTETHHRVKNNLQVVAAMVDLQLMELGPGATVPAGELIRLRGRISTLAAVHDLLTGHVKEEESDQLLSIRAVFDRLIPLLMHTAGGRPVQADIADAVLSGKQATALALIANELVSNSVKHGSGTIMVRLGADDHEATLEVLDGGPGFQAGFDSRTSANTGLQLVEALTVNDLGGTVIFCNQPSGGALVRVTIPLPRT